MPIGKSGVMRPSRVLKKLRSGEVVSCFYIYLDSSRVVDLVARCGFDCIWTDMEHTGLDWSLLERQILAGKSQDADVMVRVARGSYSDYVRPLEMDASGIMVPHITSAAGAKRVIQMTRFHPLGSRAVDGGHADNGFFAEDLRRYFETANRERFLVLQIESAPALDELDAIAAPEGFDILFFGAADFSQSIGAPGDWEHPKIAAATRRIAAACRSHGKVAGICASEENVGELIDIGYRFIDIGTDTDAVRGTCASLLKSVENADRRLSSQLEQ